MAVGAVAPNEEATTVTAVREVRGRVLRPDGSPCSSGTLVLLIGGGRMNRLADNEAQANPLFQFRTDDAGRFAARFYVPTYTGGYTRPLKDWPRSGAYQFIVQPSGDFAGALSERFYVLMKDEPPQAAENLKTVADTPIEVTLPLKKGIAVEGGVLDRDGKPVANVQVSLWTIVHMESHTSAEGGIFGQKMATGADGRYHFENVYPGQFELGLMHLGKGRDYKPLVWLRTRTGGGAWQFDRIDHFTPASGQKLMRVEIGTAPENTFAVEGRVVDPAGKPLAGVAISVGQSHHKDFQTWGDFHNFRNGKTDADGRYRVTVDTPWLRFIRAEKDGYVEYMYKDPKEGPYADESNIKSVQLTPGNYDFTLSPVKTP